MAELSQLTVEDIFARLEEMLPNYEHRPQQLDFAKAVERTLKQSKTGIFEAGTGTGKSLAALIPAALSGKRVVVSTATIALQEQYIHKDIPCLQSILPFEIKAALVKGRRNYIGLRRYEEHKLEAEIDSRIINWLNDSETGDRSELDFLPVGELWSEISSDADDCLRNKCSSFNKCFYFKARKEAEQADILVVNHALLLIDAASGGNILPPYEILIIDEAHQLPDIATNSFSVGLSPRGIQMLASRANKQVTPPSYLIHNMEEAANELFSRLQETMPLGKTRLRKAPECSSELLQSLIILRDWLTSQEFETVLDVDNKRDKLKLKAKALAATAGAYIQCLDLLEVQDPDWVFWFEKPDRTGKKIEITAAPLAVNTLLEDHIFNKESLDTTVWMSATLATSGEDPFAYYKQQVGAPHNIIQEKISSPFDYKNQSVLYLPDNLPEPNTPGFASAACNEIEHLLHLSNGRAFVLFTSYAAMNNAYIYLADRLPFASKRQGEMPRQKLIEWFKETPNSVLFATSSFWEGVSVDGDQLSCVIIDRIPFQTPDDPVYEARCELVKADAGASWFTSLALPHAIMRLKQGVGRLIRTKSDRGIVAILDPRMTKKYYGRAIISCLPPMTLVKSLKNIESLDELLTRI
ncbi:MAG: hypothetical protein K2W82_02435 [Candidatus Obscuribacterales bacterium]|nr:hypothetical protein [Candidatus Obscuribacterales bacterium]